MECLLDYQCHSYIYIRKKSDISAGAFKLSNNQQIEDNLNNVDYLSNLE